MKEKKLKHIKDSFNYLSVGLVTNAIIFFILPVYTRFLTPADFGIVVLFTMFGNVTVGLISFGLHGATYRYYFKYHDDIDTFKIVNTNNIIFNLIVFCFAGFVIWIISGKISQGIFNNRISTSLLKLSFLHGCIEYILNYLIFILIAQTRSRAVSTIRVAQALSNAGISLFLLYTCSLTYMARIYAYPITNVILLLVSLYLTKDLFTRKLSGRLFKESMKYAYPNLSLGLIGLVYSSFDKTLLSKYKGLASVGHYNVGERFANIIKTIMDSIEGVWSPFFMRKAHENTLTSKQDIVKSFLEVSFIFMFMGICIIYFSEEMIRVLTTKEFYFAMYIVPLYVFYYLFGIIGMLAINQINYSEKTLNLLPSSIVSIILNVVLNVFLIKAFGAIGAAVATAISALGAVIVLFYIANKVYPLPLKKTSLLGLYLLLIVFTVPIYPIMTADMGISIKIFLKIILLVFFVFAGFKAKLISTAYSRYLWNTVVAKRNT